MWRRRQQRSMGRRVGGRGSVLWMAEGMSTVLHRERMVLVQARCGLRLG
jgi:hypothetical protein